MTRTGHVSGGVGEKKEEGREKVSAGNGERKGRHVARVAGLQLVRAPRTRKSRPRRPPPPHERQHVAP